MFTKHGINESFLGNGEKTSELNLGRERGGRVLQAESTAYPQTRGSAAGWYNRGTQDPLYAGMLTPEWRGRQSLGLALTLYKSPAKFLYKIRHQQWQRVPRC